MKAVQKEATYSWESTQLILNASVAVMVFINAHCDDMEFIPLKPRQITESELAEYTANWPERGLRPVGVFGLVGVTPRSALREPLEPEQVSALAGAFLAYLYTLICDGFTERLERAELVELERLYNLQDMHHG